MVFSVQEVCHTSDRAQKLRDATQKIAYATSGINSRSRRRCIKISPQALIDLNSKILQPCESSRQHQERHIENGLVSRRILVVKGPPSFIYGMPHDIPRPRWGRQNSVQRSSEYRRERARSTTPRSLPPLQPLGGFEAELVTRRCRTKLAHTHSRHHQ